MASKLSQDLVLLLEDIEKQPLSLQNILERTAERGVLMLIILLVAPCLFPLPPGSTTVLGAACLLLSGQMALGRHQLWLPQLVGRWIFPTQVTQGLLANSHRLARLIDRFSHARWTRLARSRRVWRINGLCISWLTILLALPVPLTNFSLAAGILTIAIATIEADGVIMCYGYGLLGLNTALFGGLGYLVWWAPELLQRVLDTL